MKVVVAILSDDISINNGWSIPATFLEQTVKQLEVIREVVLSEVTSYTEWLN